MIGCNSWLDVNLYFSTYPQFFFCIFTIYFVNLFEFQKVVTCIKRNMGGWEVSFYSNLEVDGLIFGPILVCHYLFSLSQSIPLSTKAKKIGEIVCTQCFPKSGAPYIVGSTFSVAFQQYMALMIWEIIAPNMVDKSFGAHKDYYVDTQLNNNTID
jgi:hypothetical protein